MTNILLPPLRYSLCIIFSLFLISTPSKANVTTKLWGEVKNQPVYLYSVTNKNGMRLEMTNYGAKITSLFVHDKNGKLDDIVLGFDSLAEYVAPNQSFGATIGRYTNRI